MNKNIIWLILICLLIGGILGWLIKPEQYVPGLPVHNIDTTYILVPKPPVVASGPGIIKWKIRKDTTFIYIKDSLLYARFFEKINEKYDVYWDSIPVEATAQYILSKPFESSRTDTISGDTLNYGYHFPENYLWANISFKPDSIIKITDSVTIPLVVPEVWYNQTWFKIVTYSATAVGFFYLGTKAK